MDKPIYVTKPFLPPLEEYVPLLEQIWDSRLLTNNGPFHQQFQSELQRFCGVDQLSLIANGSFALLLALKALGVTGEVITTPYTFVATTNALRWNGNTPVFVDIEEQTFNIDPQRIEAAITPQTSAILAVHCYGIPCDVAAISDIAERHGLKVIYDAAHAFAVKEAGRHLVANGDASVLSFHATKVFNTIEGGAIAVVDEALRIRIERLKNFGFRSETEIVEVGLNAKMNELEAALGCLQLKYAEQAIARRGAVAAVYRDAIGDIEGLECLPPPADYSPNHSYFPVLVGPGYPLSRDGLCDRLKARGVVARRYFYPLVTDHPVYADYRSTTADSLRVARDRAARVLCLPIYPELTPIDQARVIETLSLH